MEHARMNLHAHSLENAILTSIWGQILPFVYHLPVIVIDNNF